MTTYPARKVLMIIIQQPLEKAKGARNNKVFQMEIRRKKINKQKMYKLTLEEVN